jgi:hypothetical protein
MLLPQPWIRSVYLYCFGSRIKDVLSVKALWAAKGGNISALEDALEEQIPVDTTDQFGNSLLTLAAQQGQ